MFELHPALQQKDFVMDLPFSRVLFEDNADYPWIFLVPRKKNVKNMLDLTHAERYRLMDEIEIAENAINSLFTPHQTNVGMLGNMTPQLHVHIIARKEGDTAWPAAVWGVKGTKYVPTEKIKMIELIKQEIQKWQKQLSLSQPD